MEVEKDTVKVRMYRQGLGDCFLLTFNGKFNKPIHMLIDFGVLQGTSSDTEILGKIAKNIESTTDKHIHVLVVTHEHWDHISGFIKAENVFKNIKIDQVWLAWTEDPENPLAKQLKKKKELYLKALKEVTLKLKNTNHVFSNCLEGILSFYGEQFEAIGRGGVDYMDNIRKIGSAQPKFLFPGTTLQLSSEVEGIRVYVFGPPENKGLIERSRPKKGEVYLTDFCCDFYDSFSAAVLKPPANDSKGTSECNSTETVVEKDPFDTRFRINFDATQNTNVKDFYDKYKNENQWRKIDEKWLDVAGDLALKLDEHTNNTSLVLAIELKESGKVLLFPGDAQVGNWLSWENLKWEVDGKKVTYQDLLARTVLYKVGHHGSHNATLREKGLELMKDPGLTAMLPVDRKMAEKQEWRMPSPPLYERLKELCKGRILRIDDGIPSEKPPQVNQGEWDNFTEVTEKDENGLYIEYTVK